MTNTNKTIFIVLVFVAIIGVAVGFYFYNYDIATETISIKVVGNSLLVYGQLEKYKSYDPVTGTINETKYILEEASPEIRAAGQKLLNAIAEQLAFGFSTGFSQDNPILAQKITEASAEFYGMVAEQDPEVFKLIQQKQ